MYNYGQVKWTEGTLVELRAEHAASPVAYSGHAASPVDYFGHEASPVINSGCESSP